MFWPIVLPLLLTFIAALILFLAIHFVGPQRAWLASTTAIVSIVKTVFSVSLLLTVVEITRQGEFVTAHSRSRSAIDSTALGWTSVIAAAAISSRGCSSKHRYRIASLS